MDGTQNSTRSYRVLTQEDREEIMIGLRMGKGIREIARQLNRHALVISREIKANSTEDGRYQACWAHNRHRRRRKQSRQREWIADADLRGYVREGLKLGWSPEQIAGRRKLERPDSGISQETIYRYVFKRTDVWSNISNAVENTAENECRSERNGFSFPTEPELSNDRSRSMIEANVGIGKATPP